MREVVDEHRSQRQIERPHPYRDATACGRSEEVASEHRLDGRPVQLRRASDDRSDLPAVMGSEHPLSSQARSTPLLLTGR
jgi:hypothetical protein